MRLLLTALFLLLGGCSFMANAGEERKMETVTTEEYKEYEADIETKIEMFDDLSIVMHYPETPNDQIDQTVLDYVNKERSDFKKESYQRVQKNGISSLQELHVDYEVVYEDPETYVVKFYETVTWGDNRKETDETVLHFNKGNGKRLSLSHFLKGEKTIADVKAYVAREMGETVTDEQMEQFVYRGDELSLPEDITIEKEEHLSWFKETYQKRFLLPASGTEEEAQGGASGTTPLTEETASSYSVAVMGGPHPKRTEELLAILEAEDRKAIFYLIGKRAARYPDQVEAIKDGGHAIVAHTWNHRLPERLAEKEKEAYRNRTLSVLEPIVDRKFLFSDDREDHPEKAMIDRANWKDEPEEWVMEQVWADAKERGTLVVSDLNEKSPRILEELLPRMNK